MKKKTILARVKREVCLRYGSKAYEVPAACNFCGVKGRIVWLNLEGGKIGIPWTDLEFDHLHPEAHGGASTAENIVLSCAYCNRSRGHRRAHPKYGNGSVAAGCRP